MLITVGPLEKSDHLKSPSYTPAMVVSVTIGS